MNSRLIKILLFTAIGLLLLKSGSSAALYLWPKTQTGESGTGSSLELIQLTNDYRKSIGLNELAINPRLTQAAVSKAKDILAKQYFNHTSPEGKKFSDWIKDANYAYFYVGENLAIDFSAPREVFDAWLKSPKHKQNIERPEFQEIGIADLRGRFNDRETDVVVQIFGSRVLGENELTEGSTPVSAIADYFQPKNYSMENMIKIIDQQLSYLLFAALVCLIITLAISRRRNSKKAKIATIQTPAEIFHGVYPKKSASPLISLYTKRPHGESAVTTEQAPAPKKTRAKKQKLTE